VPPITSTANAAVKAARKLARSRLRERASAFLVEGPQATAEAIGCLQQLFVTEEAASRHRVLVAAARDAGARVLEVTPAVLASIATTTTPQGIVGVAGVAEPDLDEALRRARLVIVCHQVRDPANAGAIVRTADAAGADAVVLTRGSVDPRNPKAVRSSAGSLFHLPVLDGPGWQEVAAACRAHGLGLAAADPRGRMPLWDADLARPLALVFGNEARGLDAGLLDDCDAVVRVPMHRGVRPGFDGAAESLNLAATVAVVTYEALRQRTATVVPAAREEG
jgi:RNA methyltransferase, TrmH family